MLKTFITREDWVSREQVLEKAREMLRRGFQVVSIEHGPVKWAEQNPDGWDETEMVMGYTITVDSEGNKSRRLPEIKETKIPH